VGGGEGVLRVHIINLLSFVGNRGIRGLSRESQEGGGRTGAQVPFSDGFLEKDQGPV